MLGLLGWRFADAITTTAINNAFGVLLGVIVIGFFSWLLERPVFPRLERRRFKAIAVLFVASAAFWFAYEQAGSTLNLFAERNTNLHAWDSRIWGRFLPGYFQSFNPVMLIILAPVIGWIWVKLGPRDLSSTAKFSIGLILVAAGFAILVPVSTGRSRKPVVAYDYLLPAYGRRAVPEPRRIERDDETGPGAHCEPHHGRLVPFISVGEYMGGYAASLYQTVPLPVLFGIVAAFCGAAGLVFVALVRPMKNLMGGVN